MAVPTFFAGPGFEVATCGKVKSVYKLPMGYGVAQPVNRHTHANTTRPDPARAAFIFFLQGVLSTMDVHLCLVVCSPRLIVVNNAFAGSSALRAVPKVLAL